MIDPAQIPPTPIYTITVHSDGTTTLDGEEITGPGGGIDAARVAALAEVRIKAAFLGRPVRVTAKEANGSAWPLIVDTDGGVTTLDRPHPIPPRQPAPAPAQPPAAPRYPLPQPLPQPVPQPVPVPQPAAAAPAPAWYQHAQEEDAPAYVAPAAFPAPVPAQAPQQPAPQRTAAYDWLPMVPDAHRPQFSHLRAQELGRDYVGAMATAENLEQLLTAQYGPHHPYAVQALTVRAWLVVLRTTGSDEWSEWTPEVVELLIEAAQRRRASQAQPPEDTRRLIRNAFYGWRMLCKEDPDSAREVANELVELLGDGKRSAEVIRWVESGGVTRPA